MHIQLYGIECSTPTPIPRSVHVKPDFAFTFVSNLSDIGSVVSDISYMSDLDEYECQSVNYNLTNGSPINVNNFNVVHYNINSITAEGRLDQLSDICSTLNLDILIITESFQP